MSPQSTQPPKTYRQLHPGQGGIFTIPIPTTTTISSSSSSSNQNYFTNAIGTSFCDTCVGIYFPLTPDKFFAAHIFPFIKDIEGRNCRCMVPDTMHWVPTKAQGVGLREKVEEMLRGMVDEYLPISQREVEQLAQSALVICPRLEDGGDFTVGHFVREALESYFGVTFNVQNKHGLAINHNTKEYDLFGIGSGTGGFNQLGDVLDHYWQKEDGEYGWTPINGGENGGEGSRPLGLVYKD